MEGPAAEVGAAKLSKTAKDKRFHKPSTLPNAGAADIQQGVPPLTTTPLKLWGTLASETFVKYPGSSRLWNTFFVKKGCQMGAKMEAQEVESTKIQDRNTQEEKRNEITKT